MTDGPVWAAFDAITGRTYVVELDVPTSVIDIGATLALITNSDEDQYTFIYWHLFLNKLVGPRAFETYGTSDGQLIAKKIYSKLNNLKYL